MKYENWLNEQFAELDGQNDFNTCIVPTKALETLLERAEGLENYVQYLTRSNEALYQSREYYRDKSDDLEENLKGEADGPQDS